MHQGIIGNFQVAISDPPPPPPPGPDTDEGFIGALYRDLLFRAPDAEGLAGWLALLQGGASRELVVSSIYESPEQRGLEVDLLYLQILGRQPSPQERESWVNAFLAGLSSNVASASFLSSAEFLAKYPAPTAFLNTLYAGLLLRAPDAEGFAGWTTFLESNSPNVVADSFVDSAEFHRIIVARFYLQYLHRAPDATGLAGWSAELDSDPLTFGDLVVDLLASDEYFTLHGGLEA